MPSAAVERLDHMVQFDGHNGFTGAGGKVDAIRNLRLIAQLPNGPRPEDIEAYLLQSRARTKGAAKAAQWYREILEGKKHRGPGGRAIE